MNICLFREEEIGKPLARRDERTEHIVKVLHKKAGDRFAAGIIGGRAGTATITRIAPKGGEDEGALSFTFEPESDGKPLYPLALVVGFPRPIQLRRLLRDVAGLGVCAVHLTGTELGEKSYMESTLVETGAAYKMLLDGTAQAASTHVPALYMHRSLAECMDALDAAPEYTSRASRAALDNIRPQSSLRDWLRTVADEARAPGAPTADTSARNSPCNAPADSSAGCASRASEPTAEAASQVPLYIAAIGSERGWTDHERALLEARGFTRCGMGSRILRTETAATVACALILDSMGKLG